MDRNYMEAEAKRLKQILDEHAPEFNDRFLAAESKVVYEQYGLGGLVFHRGYYSPSLVSDSIIGNYTRGRLRKTMPDHPDYIYGFDSDHRLITVKKNSEHGFCGREYILRDGQTEIGIGSEYLDNTSLSISECKFDCERLLSCAFGFTCIWFPQLMELREEQYTYLENELLVEIYNFHPGQAPIKINGQYRYPEQHEKYCFRVENGRLVSYTTERIIGDTIKKDPHVYEPLKRKIPGYR